MLDSRNGRYASGVPRALLRQLGITLIDTELVSRQSAPYYDNELLVRALLSLT